MKRPAHLIVATLVALLVFTLSPSPGQATGTSLYVDGKTGRDTNDGRTPTTAFKTIARAASVIPAGTSGAGWSVRIKGYTDYVYRERAIPPSWTHSGTSAAPIKFQATDYVAGSSSYVKPIVSGADLAPLPGRSWTASTTAGVWRTSWPTAPFGYGTYGGPLRTALFMDQTTILWERDSLSDLAAATAAKKGGYIWSNGVLYASAPGSSTFAGTNPSGHSVDVIMRHTFYFEGSFGVSYVEIRGLDIRHSANGIAFAQGVDHGVAADNVLTGNLPMGIGVSGRRTSGGYDPAIGAVISRNVGSYNTLQGVKLDEGTQGAQVCDNTFSHNGMQGIKVQGPRDGSSSADPTTGITICRNKLYGQDLNPTGSVYNNSNGLNISNGARAVTVEDNEIYGNDVGIHVSQETSGRSAIDAFIHRNLIHDNRRFGIFFYDGATSGSIGSGAIRSQSDVIWKNGIGIQVGRGSTNKTMVSDTLYANIGDGIKIGEGGLAAAAGVVSNSLLTNNGRYGFELVAGSKATISYTGLSKNVTGTIGGSPTKIGINTAAAGYLSTTTTSASFLRISTTSYQYTAGSKGGPVGARY